MFKNVASQKAIYFAFDATTNVPKTGDAANITPYESLDYGSVTGITDTSMTEMDATNAPGYYICDLTQAETNANTILFSAKSSTANIKVIGAPAVVFTYPTTGILAPGTSGRTLTVDASGRALSDVDTIKTNPVVNGGTITFPTTATLASTTNITGGTVTTATNVTTVNGFAANAITAAATSADFVSEVVSAVWQDTTAGDFTTANSIGKCLYINNVIPGAAGGHFIAGTNAATAITTGLTTTFTGNLTGSVASVTGAVGSVTGNVGGSVASVTLVSADGINAASIADAAIDLATFASDVGNLSMRSSTAQGGAATTITLDAGASAVDDFYNNTIIKLDGGTGAGQSRYITDYAGATKVATVTAWATNPDNTTTFSILAGDSIPGATAPTAAQVATAVWQDTTAGDFTAANSVGKSVMNGVSLGTGLTVAAVSGAVGSVTGNVGGNVAGNLEGTLTSTERNAVADALLDRANAVETGITPRGAWKIGVAADAGKTDGMDAAGTAHLRNVADSKNVVTATVDGSGNRTATTVDTT